MKKFLIATMVAGSISPFTFGKYEKEIRFADDMQKFYEKKAERKVTEDDLKKIEGHGLELVSNYSEEDLLMGMEEVGYEKPKTSQGLKEKARKINALGEILHFHTKAGASCLLAQSDKDFNAIITADDYCEAYGYALMKKMYQQLQNKADQEKK